MDKTEIYKKQLDKIFQRLLVDKYPVISAIEFDVKNVSRPDAPAYLVNVEIFYSKILSDVPKHKRLEKIKDYFGIGYNISIHEFIVNIINYVIPERILLELNNNIISLY